MAQNVNFNREVYNKKTYQKTIDTSFTEIGVESIEQQINQQPTILDFFTAYNELFYEIPEFGEINSHEFLIATSTEYIGITSNSEEVEALQNEIAQLRTDLLEAQQELINLSTNITDPSLTPQEQVNIVELKSQAKTTQERARALANEAISLTSQMGY